MTNREIILHCLKEDTDVTCRKSPCDKPEQEGNTGECCDKCALGILEEYEREVRNKAIDNCNKNLINWQYVKNPNRVNDILIEPDDVDWEGLYSAEQIINITWDGNHGCYIVFWRY